MERIENIILDKMIQEDKLIGEEITFEEYKNLKVGDVIKVKEYGSPEITLTEKVVEVKNEKSDDPLFQVRTKNLGFDFTNFYAIVK